MARHQAMVAVELEKLAKKFDRFGWDRDRGSAAQDGMIIDWMDALCDFPLDEIQAACRAAVRDNPNRMPNEGHILQQVMAARKNKAAAFMARPAQREVEEKATQGVSDEDRAARAAFAAQLLKGFGGRE